MIGDRKLHSILIENIAEFWELLAHLCSPQFAKVQIVTGDPYTAQTFGQDMSGACLVTAREEFLCEWRDFFRQLQRHEDAAALELIEDSMKHLRQKTEESIQKSLPGMKAKSKAKVDREMRTAEANLIGQVDKLTSIASSDLPDSAE